LATLGDNDEPFHGSAEAGEFARFDYLVDYDPSPSSYAVIKLDKVSSNGIVWLLLKLEADPTITDFDFIAVIPGKTPAGKSSIIIPSGLLLKGRWHIAVYCAGGPCTFDLSVWYDGQRDFWMKPCCFGPNYHSRRVPNHNMDFFWGRRSKFVWSTPTRVATPGNVVTSISLTSYLFPHWKWATSYPEATVTFTIELYERSYEIWNGDELIQISDGDVKYSLTVDKWPFVSPFNELEIWLKLTSPGLEAQIEVINSTYNETDADGTLRRVDSFFETGYDTTISHVFAQQALYDGVSKPISGWLQNDLMAHLFFHNFKSRLEYDPVVSLSHDSRIVRVTQADSTLGSANAVAVGVGVTAALIVLIALVVGAAIYIRRRGLPKRLEQLGAK